MLRTGVLVVKNASHPVAASDHGDDDHHPRDTPAFEAKAADTSDGRDDLRNLPMAEVQKRLDSSAEGLTSAEAAKRLVQYGPNEIVEQQVNALRTLLTSVWGPIPWMIEVAVVLSAVLGRGPGFFVL